jgi:GTPase SAR1 family protein
MSETRVDRRIGSEDVGSEVALNRLVALARDLGSERVFDETIGLAQRVAEGRFYVACVGQFKRGKSTLLGALLGERILPTGVLPVTTVPTVVRYGNARSARVRFQGGAWKDIPPEELTQYVSEENNPENTKGVVGVEVFFPSRLLADGMSFVDTPGLGSVFAENTAATQAFVPHIDAAIVVVGADPPIAGEELKLVEEVGKQVRHLVVVLNKADRTSDSDREIAKSFTHRVLEARLNRPIGPIYEISAEEHLEKRGPERDWSKLIGELETLARESGRSLVRTAGERGLRRLSEELLAIISEEKEALLRPIEESEQRIESLRRTIAEAERSVRDIGYLFMAEQHHLSDMFLEQRKRFLAEALPRVNSEFAESLKRTPRHFGPKFRRDAMHAAQVIAEQYVVPWLDAEQARAETEYRRVESRFVNIGSQFLKKLSESGVPELARMPNALDSEKGFRVPSRFTFEGLIRIAQPASPLRYLADIFLGAVRVFSVIEHDAQAFLDHLMDINSARVQSDVVARVQESRSQLEAEIRKLLHEVSRIAEQALEHARAARAAGAPAVEAALTRLDRIEREVLSLLSLQTPSDGSCART